MFTSKSKVKNWKKERKKNTAATGLICTGAKKIKKHQEKITDTSFQRSKYNASQ